MQLKFLSTYHPSNTTISAFWLFISNHSDYTIVTNRISNANLNKHSKINKHFSISEVKLICVWWSRYIKMQETCVMNEFFAHIG